jgi:predicted DNA-binding antitoxin AbrB/MazE fold protein
MPKVIRAIYEQGVFKPTDAVNLEEGTTVLVVIWDEEEPLESVTLESQGGRHFRTLFVEEQVGVSEDIERQVRE